MQSKRFILYICYILQIRVSIFFIFFTDICTTTTTKKDQINSHTGRYDYKVN